MVEFATRVEDLIFTNGYNVLSGRGLFSEMKNLPDFSAKFPWFGGDLQTISNQIRPALDKKLINEEKILLSLNKNDEALAACSTVAGGGENPKPVIVMLHGLGGDENSIYMREAAQYFNVCGYNVLRLNLRGAGSSAQTSLNIYHAGISDDIRQVVLGLTENISKNGVCLMGFSLGANILLKYMGEGAVPDYVKGAVAVSPPVDLKKSQQRIAQFRNRLYRRYLLKKLKNDFSQIKWSEGKAPLKTVDDITSIIEFDEQVIAPVHGFASANDYYEKSSSKQFIQNISKPTLIVHAKTDPWILSEQFDNIGWGNNENVCTIMCKDGGHVGFNGRHHKYPWHLHAADSFFSSLVS